MKKSSVKAMELGNLIFGNSRDRYAIDLTSRAEGHTMIQTTR